jgi:hypothetical protein
MSEFKGGVAEWFKAHAWKACVAEMLPGVRIPSPPPRERVKNAPAGVFDRRVW